MMSSGVMRERLLQALVRAVAERGVDGPRVVGALAQELGDDARLLCGHVVSSLHPGAGDGARHPLARLVLVDQRLGVGPGDRAVELVVDLQHRREVARGDALDLFDGDVGVGGVAPLQVVEEVGAAVDQAAHVGAHRHQQLPDRLPLEHRVEGARPEHERGREVEEVGDLLDGVGRDVTVLVLREVEQRQHRRLLLRVLRDGLAREVEVRRRERH